MSNPHPSPENDEEISSFPDPNEIDAFSEAERESAEQREQAGETQAVATGEGRTRAQAKEACRLQYISGQGTLAELSVKFKLPYATVRMWSMDERWTLSKTEVAAIVQTATQQNLAEWMKMEREEQVKRGVKRARALQDKADELLPAVDSPKDLLSIAQSEEKADGILRRNLGMESESHSGGSISVNILSESVRISPSI